MKLVLIGIQGSGKSTQGDLLQKKLNIPFLATGNIFRQLAKEENALGKYIREYMFAGHLVPDEKVLEIVSEYLGKEEYKNGYILDGFPRTVVQAEAFIGGADLVVYLKVSDKEALSRISNRNDKARKDETADAVKRRIELFHAETEPVIEYYRQKGQLVEVDGEQAIEKIHTDILQKINHGK
jgi:adenylate kinase